MDGILTVVAAALLVLLALFFVVIFGALIGAFTGWVVGWFFDTTILGIFAQIGIKGWAMWQIGLFLGFVGGFFRASFVSKAAK